MNNNSDGVVFCVKVTSYKLRVARIMSLKLHPTPLLSEGEGRTTKSPSLNPSPQARGKTTNYVILTKAKINEKCR
jgi:hypothetical protein